MKETVVTNPTTSSPQVITGEPSVDGRTTTEFAKSIHTSQAIVDSTVKVQQSSTTNKSASETVHSSKFYFHVALQLVAARQGVFVLYRSV
jgi:hypothetical protein